MPMNKSTSEAVTDYVKLLSLTVCLWMLVTVAIGGFATYNYAKNATVIENISNRSISQWWTIGLLWIPLVLQLVVLFFLVRQVRKQKQDETIRHYFKFYFKKTFIASCAYISLWLCYTIWINGNADASVVYGLRWISLLAITLLISFVVQVTYLITRSSPRNERRLFTEHDIDEKRLVSISEKLRAVAHSRRNKANGASNEASLEDPDPLKNKGSVSEEVDKIYGWLLKSRDYKIHRVTYKGTLEDLDSQHLVEALNRLVCSRGFYRDWYGTSSGNYEEVPLHVRELANRRYIEKNLLDPKNESESPKNETPDVILGAIKTWTRQKLESLIGTQKRIDRQIGQRDGIGMFPFYTLIFFFSIFLCTAYLFGFAFAFEDKHVQLLDAKQHGALFMTDEFLEDVQQTDPSLIRVADIRDASRFVHNLFAPGNTLSQYLNHHLTPRTQALLKSYDDEKPTAPSGQLLNALIYELNGMLQQQSLFEQHRFDNVRLREETSTLLKQNPRDKQLTYLNRLLLEDMFPDELARMSENYKLRNLREKFFFGSGGAGIQVAVNAEAKNAERYIAQINEASLLAVVNDVRSAIEQQKLVRIEIVGRADDNANRGNSYTSNDEVSAARVRSIRYAIQEKLIGQNLSSEQLAGLQWVEMPMSNDVTLLPKRRKSQNHNDDSEAENNAFLVLNNGSSRSTSSSQPRTQLSIDRHKEKCLQDNGGASAEQVDQAVEWWKRLGDAAKRTPVSDATIVSFYQDIKNWLGVSERSEISKALQDKISRELYQLEDLEGSKRAVEVFIFESALPRPDPEQDPASKHMALMDYVYFAMYTITTTGYGDIKPITPYTKFLCTLANMTEFFFIVVFFNTLLSLKRRERD